jgi:hypothetical protein
VGTGSGESSFAIFMSAFGAMVVVADAVLLLELGSISFPATFAVFVTVGGMFALTTIVIVAVPPLTREPIVQVTVVVPLHAPTVEDEETKLTPAGSVSVIVTPVAASGPLFVTTIV